MAGGTSGAGTRHSMRQNTHNSTVATKDRIMVWGEVQPWVPVLSIA